MADLASPYLWEEFPANTHPWLEWIQNEFLIAKGLKIEAVEEELPLYDELGQEFCKVHIDVRCSNQLGWPYIIDWKSGQIRNYNAQTTAYALAAMDKTGRQCCLKVVAYPEIREYSEKLITYSEASKFVYDLATEFEAKTSPYNINYYCEWCLHNRKCAAWTKQAQKALTVTGTLASYSQQDIDNLKNNPVRLEEFLLLYERLKDFVDKEWKFKEALLTHTDLGYKPDNFIKVTVDSKTEEVQSVDPLPFLYKLYKRLGRDKVASMITVDAVKAQEAWKEVAPDEKFPLLVKYDITEKKGYSYLRRKIK